MVGLYLREKIFAHSLSPDLSLSRCDGITFCMRTLWGLSGGRDSFSSTMSRCEQRLGESPGRRSGIRGEVAVRSLSRVYLCPTQQLVHTPAETDMCEL